MVYEWDESKRAMNLDKHGLDFADADLVLENEFVWVVDSPRGGEARSQAIAYVFEVLMVLSVAFVQRGECCRIVSFRPARRDERSAYHDWLENDFPHQ